MGRWTDIARWQGPTVNSGDGDGKPGETSDKLTSHRGVVIHIAQGSYAGTIAWQKNASADVSSHFIVSKSGDITQMVDTAERAWTQRDGNSSWISIENEGFVPNALTAAQVEANAKILAKAHLMHEVPLQLATSPTGRGLGHHSMGAENGYDWGHSECPGAAIKAQKPQILARARAIVNGDDDSMSTKAETQVNSLFDATFNGGTSMGRSVDPDGTGAAKSSNSIVAKLDYALKTLDELAARPAVEPIDYEKLADALLRKIANG